MTSDTLDLILPDWSLLDTVRRSPLPFGLWTIGDQCLIHHWLDHAVNQGVSFVRFYTADRPASVRRVLEDSVLWPVKTELRAIRGVEEAPASAILADWLPGAVGPPPPVDGWGLLQRAADMERAWLDRMAEMPDFNLISVGFSCRIHPEVKLVPPYSIGDHVLIGPGSEIGPHAVIGPGSVIAGANRVANSHLAPHSFLGPVTALENCLLESGVLFNLKNQARLDRIEPHLVSTLEKNRPSVSLRHRLTAIMIYLRLRSVGRPSGSFETFDGRVLPGDPEAGLANRIAWLPMVWRGEMPLYGVLPRTRAQLESLSTDWQNVIRHAPIGVFSYADSMGCHTPAHAEEALHAVYQASLPPWEVVAPIEVFVRNLRASTIHGGSHTS